MHLKIFPHGQGRGTGPVNYLLRLDYPVRKDEPPQVLRGDPELTRRLIDAQDRQWKFTAGVMAWVPGETVTPDQERRLMDDFEKLAFAGLNSESYDILWVRHAHAGHHELHFVIPRLELATLETRLNESERNLARLSELYKPLPPLIAAIEQDIKSGR